MHSPTGSSLTDGMVVATPAPFEPEADDPATSGQEIDHVRRVRRQILAHNAGRDVSEAADAPYYVDEDCDADIEELRRVRRQIRYLFGSAPLTVPAFVPAAQPAPTFAPADLGAAAAGERQRRCGHPAVSEVHPFELAVIVQRLRDGRRRRHRDKDRRRRDERSERKEED